LDPLNLTPEERQDLGRVGRILTPQERREHAEVEEKYRVKPLTPDERERWLLQYGGQRRSGAPPHTVGEVIQRMLEMLDKGIKAITPPRQ
jgi:truncated hemoglobin YjbI